MKKIGDYLRKQRVIFLQSLANIVITRMEKATTKTDVDLWFNFFGMNLNLWCITRDIYLD